MFRAGIVGCALLLAAVNGAKAESPIERGGYLVNTIMACGNCHTPRDADGKPVPGRELSGGLAFNTPAFAATAPNITPDRETGIGSWSDAEIKRALIEGSRPDHGRFAGIALAAIMPANFYKALLPDDLDTIIAYLRSVTPVRNEVPDPVYKVPVRRDPYPDADAGFQQGDAGRSRQARRLSGHDRPLHGMPFGLFARRVRFQGRPRRAAADRSRRATDRQRARRQSPSPTSPRIQPRASAPGPTPKLFAPSPMA